MILKNDITPEIVKKLTLKEKQQLCSEIRTFLISSVTKTGGHLASNLGAVELTVALHSVFTTPEDKIVFDVGHQAYTHKLLTGRMSKMSQLRTENGISGFPRSTESVHDSFIGGHSSISISAALGIAKGLQLKGDEHSVVAVIGDGAFTGGEVYEGLNNAGKSNTNLIIILNENEMSISKNTGSFALYLAQIRSTQKYYRTKNSVKNVLDKTPVIGKGLNRVVSHTKEMLKYAIYHSNLFESFGFKYLGPIDGHNLEELTEALSVAKMMKKPCLVHIYTKKGKGYLPAEQNSGEYHAISPKTSPKRKYECFTDTFGKELAILAEKDSRICAISAAMKYGTGLQYFAKNNKERFFDVGIAEEHALTFSCGLASQGFIPVFAVYSSFLQRCFDQIIHDGAIENQHIVLAIDRAGLVGEDGETHQGVFDVSMLSSIPNTTIYSPSNNFELKQCLNQAIYNTDGIVEVRYARGCQFYEGDYCKYRDWKLYRNNNSKLIVTYGRITANALKLQKNADVLQLLKIHPIDEEVLKIICGYSEVFVFEEGVADGGIGEKIARYVAENANETKLVITAIERNFIPYATAERQLEMCRLDTASMAEIMNLAVFDGEKEN